MGTNSKSLKICALPNIHSDDEDEDDDLREVNEHDYLYERGGEKQQKL